MQQVPLGDQGLLVSRLGLGCMGMSAFYGTPDEAAAHETIDRALELGVIFLDTADMYGLGDNEKLLASALRGRHDRVQLATKFGNAIDDQGNRTVKGDPAYVRSACDASLQRLEVDHIDLYYQHRVDPNVPIEETVGAMKELVDQGKVRYLGLSEAAASTIRRAHEVHPISALQTEYSLWTRDVETEILPTCRELGIGFVAYSPLGRGFLTGSIRSLEALEENDWRRNLPRFKDGNLGRNLALVEKVEEIAREKGVGVSQVALAWVLSRGEDVIPIPGTKRVKHLETNAAALDIEFTDEELERLDEAAPPGVAVGDRYPDMSSVNI